MKVLFVNFSEKQGGAAIAANRIYESLLKNKINCKLLVCSKQTDKSNVINFCSSKWNQLRQKLYFHISTKILKLQKTKNNILHSLNFIGVIKAKHINSIDCDIVHFHWINNETISIKEIAKIKKPIVWTFHDEWAFSGAEHYDSIESSNRYSEGYLKKNKNIKGLDLNRLTWKKKKKYWGKSDIYPIAPSRWMYQKISQSVLFKKNKISYIPNTLDANVYRPLQQKIARSIWNIPLDKKIILFGAITSTHDKRKGYDLLFEALKKIDSKNVECIVFGASAGEEAPNLKTHFVGHLYDDISINLLYNACDVMIIPSRQDNLPNTCLEAIASGVPVVAFNVGGISDMIVHEKNGYLAKPFVVEDLTKGINYILNNPNQTNFSKNSVEYFKNNFSEEIITPKLISLYRHLIK